MSEPTGEAPRTATGGGQSADVPRDAVAVVVGGSKGIGAATARLLSARGSRVAVGARDQGPVAALVEELRAAGGVAEGFRVEATDAGSLAELHAGVVERLGPVDVLLPFAGGPGATSPIVDLPPQRWFEVVDANLTSTYLALHTFLPAMLERGSGAVVTMGSSAGRVSDSGMSAAYATANAGVHHLTRVVAQEVAASGVRVNCLAPGTTLSDRVSQRVAEVPALGARLLQPIPAGRFATTDEVAQAAVFLASPAASAITGVVLDVSLGRVML